jgi:hypothetical protein
MWISIVTAIIYLLPTVYKGLFFLHPYQHLLLLVFLMIAIRNGVKWNLSVVLIGISPMTKDVEHFISIY